VTLTAIEISLESSTGLSPFVLANTFHDCPTAIKYSGSSNSSNGRIVGNLIENCQVGLLVTRVGTSLEVYHNQFDDLATYGVQNTDSSASVDAQHNWWGASSGPSGEGPGAGCAVSTYVVFSDWWSSPNEYPQGVWNVVAQRRGDTMLVDVYYDLVGDPGSTYSVSLAVSTAGGEPYSITPSPAALSGAAGSGVSPGTDLHVLWDADADGGGPYTDTMRIRVTADLD